MLTEPNRNPPKKVTIKVARAQDLVLSPKDGKNKFNTKFKVVVLGGKKKEHSSTVVSDDGTPLWNFTCIVKLHRQQKDPLCLLIEDSEGHHKGQVVIPIVKIKPRPYTYSTEQDPATSSNLLCSELEPTGKCSNPKGYLFYWIWIEDYYTDEEMESGKKSFNKSMSSLFSSSKLSLSKSHLNDSTAQLGSITELNKPVKHKKTPSLLKLNFKKKKDKGGSMSVRKRQDSDSDVDLRSNYSIDVGNHYDQRSKVYNRGDSNSGSPGSSIFINTGTLDHNPISNRTTSNPFVEKSDDRSHGSYGSIADSESTSHTGHNPISSASAGMNFLLPSEPISDYMMQNNFVVSEQPEAKAMTTDYDNTRHNHIATEHSKNFTIPSVITTNNTTNDAANINVNVDYGNTLTYQKKPTESINSWISNDSGGHTQQDLQQQHQKRQHLSSNPDYEPRHSSRSSDFSFSMDKNSILPSNISESGSLRNKEMELLQNELNDTKKDNVKLNEKLRNTESELEDVKEKLFKLRVKILESGETKFLEV